MTYTHKGFDYMPTWAHLHICVINLCVIGTASTSGAAAINQ
jgi:hypothetical protein